MIDTLIVAQQFCDPSVRPWEYLTNFEFMKAFTCVYAASMGLAVFALIVYTAVASSIYIRTGSVIIPLGIMMMAGGAVITQMAAVATPFVVLLLLVAPAGGVAYLYYRFSF